MKQQSPKICYIIPRVEKTPYGLDKDSYNELSWQNEAIGNDIADDLLSNIDGEGR